MTMDRASYLQGRYDTCRLLLSSPRMNKAQSEVIRDLALAAKEELERLGVGFTEMHHIETHNPQAAGHVRPGAGGAAMSDRDAQIREQEAWLDEPEAPITREQVWRQAYQPERAAPLMVAIAPRSGWDSHSRHQTEPTE